MYINAKEFLYHMENKPLAARLFKDAPSFNIGNRETGKLTIKLKAEESGPKAAKASAIDALQSLYDVYMMAKFATTDSTDKIDRAENLYICIDNPNGYVRAESLEDNIYSVTFPFVGARGFASYVTGIIGNCIKIEISRNNEDEAIEAETYDMSEKIERLREDMTQKYQMDFLTYLNIEEPIEKVVKQYLEREFKTSTELVKFLNRNEIDRENIIDIYHTKTSHVLIYLDTFVEYVQ